MRHPQWETLPEDIQAVRERFETWRQTRLGRSRIPAALWAAAAQLARRHGVHRVARVLGLNDFALRNHALEAAPDAVQTASPEPALASSKPSTAHGPEAPADVAALAQEPVNAPLPAAPRNTPAAPAAPAKPATPPPANSSPHSSPPTPAFIQLPWPALAPAASPTPPRCVVELLHPGGARMTITLHDPGGAGHAAAAQPCASGGLDLAALARAFWSQSP
jgi:hypothetical protein